MLTTGFEALLEFAQASSTVLRNAALPEESVDPQPVGSLGRRGDKQRKAAPAILLKRSNWREQFRARRIQMHVVAHSPQVATFTSDEQGFVAPGENVAAQFVAAVEARRVGAEKPFHA